MTAGAESQKLDFILWVDGGTPHVSWRLLWGHMVGC